MLQLQSITEERGDGHDHVMLAARSAMPNSAGYVALELVRGTVGGHTGTFTLQHSGTMNRGAASLVLTVVPDSGGRLGG